MPENPEIDDDSEALPVDGDEAEDGVEEFLVGPTIVYDSETERMKVYGSILRATSPRIGAVHGYEAGKEIEIDPDVDSARNLALLAIWSDIRRMAGGTDLAHGENS